MKKLVYMVALLALVFYVSGCQEAEQAGDQVIDTPVSQDVVEDVEVQTATEEAVETEEVVARESAEEVIEEVVVVEEAEEAIAEETIEVEEIDEEVAAEEVIEESEVVVTVNGREITEEEIAEEVEKRVAGQKKRMPEGTEMPDSFVQQIRSRVVDAKVQQVLLEQQMAKQGLEISDEQILEEIRMLAEKKGQTMEQVEAEIAGYGMTMEDLKGQVLSQMQAKTLVEAADSVVVSEADAQKFYDENPQQFENTEQVKASHILCGKRGIKPEEYPAQLEKIEAAQARLEAGETFEDVAKDVSTCPSSAKGGDLGFFGKGQMDPAFEKAAFELTRGQTSGIVKSSFGYHIIKVTDKKEAGKQPFEEVKEQLTQYLTQQKQRETWSKINQSMFESAVIEYSAKEQALRDKMQKAAPAPRPIQVQPKTAE